MKISYNLLSKSIIVNNLIEYYSIKNTMSQSIYDYRIKYQDYNKQIEMSF